ncbi:MAG: NUDIX domain-containing protein [Balneolaceae bacterium]
MAKKKLIDLYPYRLNNGKPEFLVLKRASGKIYQHQWRMIGGKVEQSETFWEAALRELKEETDLSPNRLWTIPSINQFYEHTSDTIHSIPAFAAEIGDDNSLSLDDEHSSYEWIDPKFVENYILWPEQRRLIHLTNSIIISNEILDDWLVPIHS